MSNRLKQAFELEIAETTRNWQPVEYSQIIDVEFDPIHGESYWRRLVRFLKRPWFTVPATAVLVWGVLAVWPRTADSARGSIQVPIDGSAVGRNIQVTGHVENLAPGFRLVLFVERDGWMWPKESELRIQGADWDGTIFDLGQSPGKFKLSLWAVSPSGQRDISVWLDQAYRSKNFRGLPGVSGAVWLDAVQLTSSVAP